MSVKHSVRKNPRQEGRMCGQAKRRKKELYAIGKQDTDYPAGTACVPMLTWLLDKIR